MKISKKDFEVYDKHLDKDNSYKSLGNGRWYNHEMYQEALVKNGDLSGVTTRNWFEKLPIHWKLIYYYIGGIITGLLLHYVW